MSKIKRLRVFAGPNGSGKSTLFNEFSKNYSTGYFINSDEIGKSLEEKGFIDLVDYDISVSQKDWNVFLRKEQVLSLVKKSEESGHKIDIEIKENLIIDPSKDTHSYESALVSMFLREKLIENNKSFSFETVMSHSAKLGELETAKKSDYKIYLYFICIDNPEINNSRIDNRVHKGGHNVDIKKVIERYPKTLENLYPAIQLCDKTYLFDNSGEKLIMIAEILEDSNIQLHVNQNEFPNWFGKYVLNHYLCESRVER